MGGEREEERETRQLVDYSFFLTGGKKKEKEEKKKRRRRVLTLTRQVVSCFTAFRCACSWFMHVLKHVTPLTPCAALNARWFARVTRTPCVLPLVIACVSLLLVLLPTQAPALAPVKADIAVRSPFSLFACHTERNGPLPLTPLLLRWLRRALLIKPFFMFSVSFLLLLFFSLFCGFCGLYLSLSFSSFFFLLSLRDRGLGHPYPFCGGTNNWKV